jgi:uncharacterized protein with von Willebrand factor type A (vWA) domain
MIDLLLLDLFQQLRQAGMKLTPEQYDLLQQSLQQGYGLGGWDDLKRLCRLLWVKPSPDYDAAIFERAFDHYVATYHRQFQSQSAKQPQQEPRSKVPDSVSSLPPVPPRRMPSTQGSGDTESPIAVKTLPPNPAAPKKSTWVITPQAFPLTLETMQGSWKSLRRPERSGDATEIDFEATLDRIQREGFLAEVVLRPERRLGAELLLLVDDSEAMLPFRPAFEVLIQAVNENRITPAQIYRFTSYPDEYLYEWARPTHAIPFSTVYTRLHRSRTIVLVISDAGAATRTRNPQRQEGIATFLDQIAPCIRQLIWVNPLPPDRWTFTTAESIAQALDGGMIHLDAASLQSITKVNPADSTMNLWSLLSPTLNRETT